MANGENTPQERNPIKEIMCLSNLIKRSLDGARMERGETVTPMHGFIIGYLSRHSDQDIFQKDIEKIFSYRRSTASTVLGLMEEKGLIERRPVNYDARLKKIVLTDKAKRFADSCEEDARALGVEMTSGLSDEEYAVFIGIIDRIKQNLKGE